MPLKPKKPIKVAIADLGKSFGGGQRQAYNLARMLSERGVVSCVYAYPDGLLLHKCRKLGLNCHPLAYDGLRITFDAFFAADTLRKEGATIFHASDTRGHMLGALAKLFYPDLKLVVTSRTILTNPNWLSKKFKYSSPPVDMFVAVCEAVGEHLKKIGVDEDRINVINSGVDLQYFNDKNRTATDTFALGTACTLHENKGVDIILKALSKVKDELGQFRFKVAGKGPLRSHLQNMSLDLGLRDNIEFLGFVDEMRGFYRSLDVYILASFSEGIAGSLIEAGACGAVPVGSNVGGVPEVIEDNINGMLFTAGDFDMLAGIILKLANESILREKLSAEFKNRLHRFDIRKLADKHMRLYERLITQ